MAAPCSPLCSAYEEMKWWTFRVAVEIIVGFDDSEPCLRFRFGAVLGQTRQPMSLRCQQRPSCRTHLMLSVAGWLPACLGC